MSRPIVRVAALEALDQLARGNGHRSHNALRGPARHAELVTLRRGVALALRRNGWALAEIARLLNRHHTTVMHLLDVPPDTAQAEVVGLAAAAYARLAEELDVDAAVRRWAKTLDTVFAKRGEAAS